MASKSYPRFSLEAFQALVADYAQASYTLSAESYALLLSLAGSITSENFYHDDASEITTSEKDDIDEWIANTAKELMEGFPLNTTELVTQTLLFDSTLSSPDIFDVDLDALVDLSLYDHIEIQLHVAAHAAITFVLSKMYLNNDTTNANYDSSRIINFTSLVGQNNAAKPYFGGIPGGSAPSLMFSDFKVWIPYIHGVGLKNVAIWGASTANTTYAQIETSSITWNNDNEITRVRFEVENANPNFMPDSRIRIIGHGTKTVYTP